MSWRGGGRSCPGFESTRSTASRPTKEKRRSLISSEDARSFSSITSCSGPDYTAGCPSCSAIADGFNGFAVHLANHDVMLWVISRAPLAKLQAFRQRMGWTFPWASSFDSDFNWDFSMSLTEEQQREGGTEYNYRPQPAYTPPKGSGPNIGAQVTGTDPATYARERPGMSAFVLEDGNVYHSYSAFARGLDGLWGAYQWLDRAPKGRNEPTYWWRHHDKYENA